MIVEMSVMLPSLNPSECSEGCVERNRKAEEALEYAYGHDPGF